MIHRQGSSDDLAAREAALGLRYSLRTEEYRDAGCALEILLPAAADELIDASEFNVDERLPYWAELWPSARALASHLLRRPSSGTLVVELGCGLALPSLALLSRGERVLATDYYPEALEFAGLNALRNRLPPLPTLLVDWRMPPRDFGPFQRVIAADVLYELRNAESLASLLPELVAPGGEFLLGDPGRVYLSDFEERMRGLGWSIEERESLRPTAASATDIPPSTVSIRAYRAPAGAERPKR